MPFILSSSYRNLTGSYVGGECGRAHCKTQGGWYYRCEVIAEYLVMHLVYHSHLVSTYSNLRHPAVGFIYHVNRQYRRYHEE